MTASARSCVSSQANANANAIWQTHPEQAKAAAKHRIIALKANVSLSLALQGLYT